VLPVLFTVGEFPVKAYGVSKALAAIVAGLVLARAFRRRGLDGAVALALVLHAMLWGFLRAKLALKLKAAQHATAIVTGLECPWANEAGAFVVNALDPADQEAFLRHLGVCAACRHEVIELTPIAQLLTAAGRSRPGGEHRATNIDQ